MPPPRKLDLIGDQLRAWLAEELMARGFADIVAVTEALNFRLEEEGLEVRIGKTAVGEFSKLLKDQRDAFAMAETLLADMDIEAESNMHKVLMQMIATAAMHMMQAVSADEDAQFDPKSLASLSRMLKDLMHSAGMREKLRADEVKRVRAEAEKDLKEQFRTKLADGVASGATNEAAANQAAAILGFER